jgi:GntR family transcriptional regulator
MADAKLQFEIHPSSGVPIFRQIMDQVRALVGSRQLKPGDMIPSIRQLSSDLEVNMMTVSKAYAKLEAEGILERVRGTGMRVSAEIQFSSLSERQSELEPLAEALVSRAQQLGLTPAQTVAVVQNIFKEQATWQKQ